MHDLSFVPVTLCYQFEVILLLSIRQMQICTGLNPLRPYNNESKYGHNLCYGIFSFMVLVSERFLNTKTWIRIRQFATSSSVWLDPTPASWSSPFCSRLTTGRTPKWLQWGSCCSTWLTGINTIKLFSTTNRTLTCGYILISNLKCLMILHQCDQ